MARIGELIHSKQETLLIKMESQILDGIGSVGRGLCVIRVKELWKHSPDCPNASCFEDYCRDRFGFGGNYGNKLIRAEEFKERVGTIVPNPPTVEGQVREILKAP